MGDFVQHEPCPECGSKDNVGVYTDGKYCFGCGWIEGVDKILHYKNYRASNVEAYDNGCAFLPYDSTFSIPNEAMDWLKKYSITDQQIANHKLQWSDLMSALIFPIYDGPTLRGWNGRIFGERAKTRKYDSRGLLSKLDVFIPPQQGEYDANSLVVVEGFMDAIKVSNTTMAMPLFGVSLNESRITRLAKNHNIRNLTLWLDHDKIEHMLWLKKKYSHLFNRLSMVVEKIDPKGLSDDYIIDKLLETLD